MTAEDFQRHFSKQHSLSKAVVDLRNFSKQRIGILGSFQAPVKVLQWSCSVVFYVTDKGTSLLGLDAIQRLGIQSDGASLTTCRLASCEVQCPSNMDNQLPDAVFPIVLHRSLAPMTRQPMLEAALLLHHTHWLNSVKYLKVLLQELHLSVDKGFLLSVYDAFSAVLPSLDEVLLGWLHSSAELLMPSSVQKMKLKSDMKMNYAPLHCFKPDIDTSNAQRTMFEFIHLSPVHLSFSPRGTVQKANKDGLDVLDGFLNLVGATISEFKDVELRLAFFEQKGRLVSPAKLLKDIRAHYALQVVQQCYVLILGMDVLGNPYTVIRDFTKGCGDFFYQPSLGSVQSPEEFAEGLSRGAHSLMGHVIGNPAAAVAQITGSLGQAVLSFDDHYQNKIRQRRDQPSSSLPESLSTTAKGFVHGILLGISGVGVSPLAEAHSEGLESFFRGIGKGLMGLMTKPAGGVVDMFTIGIDGIQRATEMGKGVVMRQRLPRFINPNLGLRPFSQYQATGYQLLLQFSKGHYSQTDTYWAHAPLDISDEANTVMITNRHVFLLEKCQLWGGWTVQWSIRLEDIVSVPFISGTSLVIQVRQDESVASFMGSERFLVCQDEGLLKWLKLKIETVLLFTMEERPCPLDG
ncbi:hypothetical protein MRX96_022656 [Rhipicephalus microplus]